jgi:hypothetical protein
MLGYMTKKEALAIGFTHHGSYYGIPVWITEDYFPMVAAKWSPLEYVMTLFHYVEAFIQSLSMEDRGFMFHVGPPIK